MMCGSMIIKNYKNAKRMKKNEEVKCFYLLIKDYTKKFLISSQNSSQLSVWTSTLIGLLKSRLKIPIIDFASTT